MVLLGFFKMDLAVRLTADPINPGSYAVRVWLNEPPGEDWTGTQYDLVCNINWLNQHECEIAPCKGRITPLVIRALIHKCAELGFEIGHFCVARGTKLGHIADYVKTVGVYDYYSKDLVPLRGGGV